MVSSQSHEKGEKVQGKMGWARREKGKTSKRKKGEYEHGKQYRLKVERRGTVPPLAKEGELPGRKKLP